MSSMTATAVSAPVHEFLAWIAVRPRTYAETMAAWTTHCPRLTIWEDALTAHLVEVVRDRTAGSRVRLSADGIAALEP
jgi:hypothetical protein